MKILFRVQQFLSENFIFREGCPSWTSCCESFAVQQFAVTLEQAFRGCPDKRGAVGYLKCVVVRVGSIFPEMLQEREGVDRIIEEKL